MTRHDPSPVRQIVVTLTPGTGSTSVTLVVRDWSGASRWDRGIGHFTLPVDRRALAGKPLADVLRDLGWALQHRYDTTLPEAGPEPPGGLQGGLKTRRNWEALTLDLR